MSDIDLVIKDGLAYIAAAQQKSGGFVSLSGFSKTDFGAAVPYITTFFTAAILSCLNVAAHDGLFGDIGNDIRSRAAAFLTAQKSPGWSFNYWARGAPERAAMPYPDDLDDTFCALSALVRHDPSLLNGEVLAAAATILTGAEVGEGGPYRTWLTAGHDERWSDVDIVVNSTIGHFLSLADVRLPHIEAMVAAALKNGVPRSPCYPGAAQVLYFISRHCRGLKERDDMRRLTAKMLHDVYVADGAAMTPLEHIMITTALMNCGANDDPLLHRLPKTAHAIAQEGWKPYAFCIDPSREGRRSYAGASALTAALVLEALALYQKIHRVEMKERRATQEEHIHATVIALARKDIRVALGDSEFADVVTKAIDDVADHKITTLAYEFNTALKNEGCGVHGTMADWLAIGNLYGWVAYTIYDDIFDGEEGAGSLAVANTLLRMLVRLYHRNGGGVPGGIGLFHSVMSTIDAANDWEQRHCIIPDAQREFVPGLLPDFGDHGRLADWSIGHALVPLMELIAAGYETGSRGFQATLAFFRHYLIARQLHDDAHDWADDLLRGRVNSVGAMVLKRFRCNSSGSSPDKEATLCEILPALRGIFWEEAFDEVAALICSHVDAARDARASFGPLAHAEFMENVLFQLECGAQKAIVERNDALLFIKHYRKTD